jgi:hypothetical protein
MIEKSIADGLWMNRRAALSDNSVNDSRHSRKTGFQDP